MDNKLKLQRLAVNNFIIFCEAVLVQPEPNLSTGYLEAKSKLISELWSKLDLFHDVILMEIEEEDKATQAYFVNKDYESAFKMYDKVSIKIQQKLEKFRGLNPQIPPITLPENLVLNAVSDKSNIKLKPIDIPTFTGDYKKWISFKNMFDSLIHNSEAFSRLQKIHYLKSCLSGEAERIISQFDVTEDSYDPAYKALTERFHNEVILIDTHIISILSQPNLTNESSNDIKELLDVTTENIRALNSLKVDTSTWDPILLLLLVQKMDNSSRRLWEQTLKPKTRPTLKEFLDFLSTRFHALGCQQKFKFSIESSSETIQSRNNKPSYQNYKTPKFQGHQFPPRNYQNFLNSTESIQRKCPFRCGGTHSVMNCERFQSADPRIKTDLVTCARLCKNCLKGHQGRCALKPGCQKCGRNHHELLHFEQEGASLNNRNNFTSNSTSPPAQETVTGTVSEISLNSHHAHLQQDPLQDSSNVVNRSADYVAWDEPVLLATAIIMVRSARDKMFYPFRALLDQASEASYVSEHVTQVLGLQKTNVLASTSGLGGVTTNTIKHVVDFEVGSKRNPAFSIKVQAPVVQKVTNPLPSTRFQRTDWKHIQELQLADPEFHVPGRIDILLGAPVYGYLLLPGLIKISPESPVAQNTEFGWILSGGTRSPTSLKHNISSFHLKIDLDDQLRKFFEQEEVSKERILTQEEVECERFFESTYRRNEEGRFIVALPFKGDPNSLGSSKGQAISRLLKLESKFSSNNKLKEEYTEILEEYEKLNHTTVLGSITKQTEQLSYYLPHHAVFKPESTTTKTRVVFDASAKSTTGNSLNELLMTGPTLQEELLSILTRWRSHEIVFSADIAKMYRQVEVREEDRKYQKFLFRKNENEEIQEHQHNMVTFGVTSATYLAVKSLQKLVTEEEEKYPTTSKIVLRDFYMDDVMSGADTVHEGIEICKDLKKLLAGGKFELRKFISNSTELLKSIPEKDRELKLPLEINLDSTIKTLGIHYHPSSDHFQFKVNLKYSSQWPTKRSLLSETAKLFDPLGWLAPVVIRAKIFFQKLWQEGLTWDQKLPAKVASEWIEFRNELHQLENIKVKRWFGRGDQTKKFELHGFSDASETAYSAVIYARNVDHDDSIQITMLTSKTRVAPIKPITLPCLELCGAVLLANLMHNVHKALDVGKENIHTWTDSTVVLGWLRTNPAKLKTFVANRVVEIHNFLNVGQWHHIEGANNPADCASRGIRPTELENHKLWWNGPDILRENRSSWDQKLVLPPATLELKTKILSTHVITPSENLNELMNKYSSFKRLVRMSAICLKFIDNLKSSKTTRISNLCLTFINNLRIKRQKVQLIITAEDLLRAALRLIRLQQGRDFSREIHHLMKKRPINKKSKILSLNPFLDNQGCLRVGGRLEEANLPYDRKHPLILDSGTIVRLIISDMHEKSLHGGTQLTMNLVKETYWVINLRRQVKECILNCVTCYRFRQDTGEQIMANLPQARVNPTSTFTHTGMDYAGPFNIKASNVRSPPIRIQPIIVNGEVVKSIPKVPIYEGYIALFVCFATKAIHLEVVSDMSTPAFLAAFDRFTSRRGFPECCYSDNAKTFIGAKHILSADHEKSILDYKKVTVHVANDGINWKFIPPRAPHHGSIWESNIKSMKHHLKRVVGNTTLTFEELSTVSAKIEACLNSRPLCPISDDPSDLSVLTPGHFLIGRPLLIAPKGKSNVSSGKLKERWNLVQKIQGDFWKAWSQEYLNQLQHRPKWEVQRRNFKEGDIVLLKEDNIPPTKWPLARITKVHPGLDMNVRSVTIKTTSSESGKLIELDRPIVKLCLLPIIDNETTELVNLPGANINQGY